MKIYKITFNKYTNGLQNTVCNEKNNKCIAVAKDFSGDTGYLMFLTNDISQVVREFQSYGEGIKKVKYIGKGALKEYEEEI